MVTGLKPLPTAIKTDGRREKLTGYEIVFTQKNPSGAVMNAKRITDDGHISNGVEKFL